MTTIRRSPRARRTAALLVLAACAACGGGGALLPTEPGTGGVPGGGGGPGGGGDDVAGGGDPGSGAAVTVTVRIGEEGGFSPAALTIPAGATVVWQVAGDHHDVTFAGAAPAGGGIADIDEGESASRTFTEAGTYEYFCERHDDDGETGVIVVEGVGDGGTGGGEPQGARATVRTPGDSFSPASVTITAGGTVEWQIAGDQHNVTFTGAAPPGGSIPTTTDATVARSFPTAGRYDYFCTRHSGMTGAVVVQ